MNSVLDKDYINTIVKNYFLSLFGKKACIGYSKTTKNIRCWIYSKEVHSFLAKTIGLPIGKKKYNKKNVIPEIFFKEEILLKSSIKGLFDTEGGFYQHNKTSPRIYIYNTSEPLLKSLHRALETLNYHAMLKKNAIKICRKNEITRFFNEIGSNNIQKLLKYKIWLKEGKVPKEDRLIKELTLHGSSSMVECDPPIQLVKGCDAGSIPAYRI